MRFKLIVATLFAFVLVIVATHSAQAVSYDVQPVYSISCDQIGIAQQVLLNPNRDTSGSNKETLSYRVIDGDGTVLFSADDTLDLSAGFPYTATWFFFSGADYNPIHLLIYSPAGNGFETEVYTDQYGTCDGLPTYVPAAGESLFSGPGLPSNRNLVLALGDIAVLDSANGIATGAVIRQCQTVFITSTSDDGLFGRAFVMGGWILLENTVDVAENYGQPGGQARYPGCENK